MWNVIDIDNREHRPLNFDLLLEEASAALPGLIAINEVDDGKIVRFLFDAKSEPDEHECTALVDAHDAKKLSTGQLAEAEREAAIAVMRDDALFAELADATLETEKLAADVAAGKLDAKDAVTKLADVVLEMIARQESLLRAIRYL